MFKFDARAQAIIDKLKQRRKESGKPAPNKAEVVAEAKRLLAMARKK